MPENKYLVNDIDGFLADKIAGARNLGWRMTDCRTFETEPLLFPIPDERAIVAMVRKALERECSHTCGDECYHPHPLLQFEPNGYLKMCRVMWKKLTKIKFED